MHVEVRSTFDGRWVTGFEVVGWEGPDDARLARLRRLDGSLVPDGVPEDRIRVVGTQAPRVPRTA